MKSSLLGSADGVKLKLDKTAPILEVALHELRELTDKYQIVK